MVSKNFEITLKDTYTPSEGSEFDLLRSFKGEKIGQYLTLPMQCLTSTGTLKHYFFYQPTFDKFPSILFPSQC